MSGIKHADVGEVLTKTEYDATDSHEIESGTSFPGSPAEKDLYYRSDEHKWYIYNGTDWKELGGTDISDADALVTDVKSTKTFYSVEEPKKTGTMPTVVIVATNDNYPEGYHAGNVGGLDAIDTDLVPANIKKDINIFGKVGILAPGYTYSLGNLKVVGAAEARQVDDPTINGIIPRRCNFTSYGQIAGIKLLNAGFDGKTIRITFKMAAYGSNGFYTAFGKIYRGAVGVGTERSNDNDRWYTTYTEDIAGWSQNDWLNLYAKTESSGGPSLFDDFYILGDVGFTEIANDLTT